MSIFNRGPKVIRTYKDKHGATVRVLAEHKGPNRAQRRGTRRIDHGIPWYEKEPYASRREAVARRVKHRIAARKERMGLDLDIRQRSNAIRKAAWLKAAPERKARREARRQAAIEQRLARV